MLALQKLKEYAATDRTAIIHRRHGRQISFHRCIAVLLQNQRQLFILQGCAIGIRQTIALYGNPQASALIEQVCCCF